MLRRRRPNKSTSYPTVNGRMLLVCDTADFTGKLLFAGRLLASQNYEYLKLFTIVFVIYFVISYPAMLAVRWLEKHTSLQRRRPRRALLTELTDDRIQPEAP